MGTEICNGELNVSWRRNWFGFPVAAIFSGEIERRDGSV
jgi:hypothetical protein